MSKITREDVIQYVTDHEGISFSDLCEHFGCKLFCMKFRYEEDTHEQFGFSSNWPGIFKISELRVDKDVQNWAVYLSQEDDTDDEMRAFYSQINVGMFDSKAELLGHIRNGTYMIPANQSKDWILLK
jgi:hypothetical protein